MKKETIKLKNGSVELRSGALGVFAIIKKLFKEKPILFYELILLCRDPSHEPWGEIGQDLVEQNLIEQTGDDQPKYTVHALIKNVVLSSIEGNDIKNMRLVNPFIRN